MSAKKSDRCEECDCKTEIIVQLREQLKSHAETNAMLMVTLIEDNAVIRRQSEALDVFRRQAHQRVLSMTNEMRANRILVRGFRWDDKDGWHRTDDPHTTSWQ